MTTLLSTDSPETFENGRVYVTQIVLVIADESFMVADLMKCRETGTSVYVSSCPRRRSFVIHNPIAVRPPC